MIDLKKDGKGNSYLLTQTDNEGYHKQINLTSDELNDICKIWHSIQAT